MVSEYRKGDVLKDQPCLCEAARVYHKVEVNLRQASTRTETHQTIFERIPTDVCVYRNVTFLHGQELERHNCKLSDSL